MGSPRPYMTELGMNKTKFSPREIKCLTLYFSGLLMKDAARAAGYRGSSDQALCNQARAVINKYEQSASAKEIFHRAGASEVRIAQLLTSLVQNAKSESAQLKALSIIAKCLGMQREPEEPYGGRK